MSDLMELLERVKAATGPDRELDVALEVAFPYDTSISHSHRPSSVRGKVTCRYNSGSSGTYGASRYTASIDAALALVERRLPEWVVYDLSQNSRHAGDPWGCTLAVFYGGNPSKNRSAASGYDYPTAPLAILAALLSALTSGASS